MRSTSEAETACTVFAGNKMITQGLLSEVISHLRGTWDERKYEALLLFDDATGKPIDVNWQMTNSLDDARASSATETDQAPRRAGRPKLGVVSGEVTLLPRQWEWLKSQPGGASVTIRKLIDDARRSVSTQSKVRASQEAAHHFMTAMAGDFPQYEEALRELYGGNSARFRTIVETWEPDIAHYVKRLAANAFGGEQ